jgi:palmitoyl-protein thioesterase
VTWVLQDWLGLRAMDEAGKLVFLSVDGDHLQLDPDWFVENIVNGFLKND